MIVTRTPLRISFAGGGSDVEAFFQDEPGAVLSTTIDKYVYVIVHGRFDEEIRICGGLPEAAHSMDRTAHPIARECLQHCGVTAGVEVFSASDLPPRSGLGSSSSFTVGLLHALHVQQGACPDPEQLAREACGIEIERLYEPIGKQDQYIAAYGGMRFIRFSPDGTVIAEPADCAPGAERELHRHLLLYFTGTVRDSREVLRAQSIDNGSSRELRRSLRDIAGRLHRLLQTGKDFAEFGVLLDAAWRAKRSLGPAVSTPFIDGLYQLGLDAGALGGKLLGAGGGGFLLFFCDPRRREDVRRALAELREVPFAFTPEGSRVVYQAADVP